MLRDLQPLKDGAINAINSLQEEELNFTQSFRNTVLAGYNRSFPQDDWNCKLSSAGLKIINSNNQLAYLPLEWFSKIRKCSSYIIELQNYAEHIAQFKRFINNSRKADSILKKLPCINWRSEAQLTQNEIQDIDNFLASLGDTTLSQRLDNFFDGRSWLIFNDDGKLFGKKLDRQSPDYIASTVRHISKLIADTSGKLDQLMKVYLENEDVRSALEDLNILTPLVDFEANLLAENKIFYGAPGVGKSYQIDQLCDSYNSIRTVFHPDSQYSDFIGCLKPKMLGSRVVYEFRPGPFTLAFIKASLAPDQMFYLVIEEINRASAAAVFGELFQLLDRSPSGESCYEVTLSDPDMVAFINDKAPSALNGNNIKIPANLSLFATMNSSDQAVMPMDTAFKRRWKFEYIPIDFSECPHGIIEVPVGGQAPIVSTWKYLAESINEILEGEDIPEDRLLGPWFLNASELDSLTTSADALKGKLLLYLWDDVLRHGDKGLIFAEGIMSYGNLVKNLDSGDKIFSSQLERTLTTKQPRVPQQNEVENEQDQITLGNS